MNELKEIYVKLFNKITDIISELQLIQVELDEAFILHSAEEKHIENDEAGETSGHNNDLYTK